MRRPAITLVVLIATLGSGCALPGAGKGDGPLRGELKGPIEGYLAPFNIKWPLDFSPALEFLESERAGELLGVDLGSLGGVGGGLSGIRARVLSVEGALGTTLFPPKAKSLVEGEDTVEETDDE